MLANDGECGQTIALFGTAVGRFRVLSPLGRGGMGEVAIHNWAFSSRSGDTDGRPGPE